MAEPGPDDQDELKKKLVRRVGIAGVLIVVLLGGLTLLEDALLDKPAAPPAPGAAAPAPAPAQAEPQKTEAPPAEEKQEEAKPEEEKKEEPRAEPEKTETPLAPAPVPEPRPASRVVIKPPAAAPAAPAKQAAPAKVEKVEKVEPAAPAPAPKADPVAALARSYRLQMGVFTSASNAEELHAKLEQAGIPSYVESRVHVGPFKTQKEADAARRKLKELGLGPGLLIPPQKR
jgi:DedD protein